MPPVVIAAVIGAAGTAGGAALAAHGATSAANDQAQTAANALAFEKQQLAQKQSLLQPYEGLGEEGGSQLGSLLGLAPLAPRIDPNTGLPLAPGTVAPTNLAAPTSGPTINHWTGQPWKPTDPGYAANQASTPGSPTMGAASTPPSGLASLGPGSPNASATVKMLAPDGTVQAVPTAQVAHYQQLGAQVIQ